MRTSLSSLPMAPMRSRMRSWVSGRGGTTPCWANAMAVASAAPIQIGKYRSPATSRSNTMGWFEGISTRTPTTSTSRTRPAYSREDGRPGGRDESPEAAQTDLHEDRVQAHREGCDLGGHLVGATLGRLLAAAP